MHVLVRYADCSLYEGNWEDAPDYEVQTVCYVDPDGIAILRHQGDFYFYEDGEIFPTAYHAAVCEAYREGFIPHRHPELELIAWLIKRGYKQGTMVGPVKWRNIYNLAVQDRDSLR